MSTKVKGEAIKEGSIPMSALSTEVKNKIENAGGGSSATPDWDAKEGEVGYIKNRICYDDTNKDDLSYYEERNSTKFDTFVESYIKWDGVRDYVYSVCQVYELMNAYIEVPSDIDNDRGGYSSYETIKLPKSFYVYEDGVIFEKDTPLAKIVLTWNNDDEIAYLYFINYPSDVMEFETSDVKFYFEGDINIKTIESKLLPNTVLKTTPQTLSDADKNQALTNLGIDPVVWKYMCNPCIIKSGNKVPEELIGDFDEEEQCFYFKYPYKNMYVVEFRGHRINLTDATVISIKADGCIENATNEINIVNVEVWIDKDKEWYVEG